MEERQDLISRQVAIDLVKDVCDAIMSGCESWYDPETEDEVYKDIREVDAILKCNKEIRIALRNMPPSQPEYLHVIMEKIRKNYEKAMNVSYINDPMAVALSETWKEYVDEKGHKRG